MQAFTELSAMNLIALGGNCGNGPEEIEGVIQAMYAANQEFPLSPNQTPAFPNICTAICTTTARQK